MLGQFNSAGLDLVHLIHIVCLKICLLLDFRPFQVIFEIGGWMGWKAAKDSQKLSREAPQ